MGLFTTRRTTTEVVVERELEEGTKKSESNVVAKPESTVNTTVTSTSQPRESKSESQQPAGPTKRLFLFKSITYIIFSTVGAIAAGAAAANHANRPFTTTILRASTLAGSLAALILTFARYIKDFSREFTVTIPLLVLTSSFGICVVVLLAVCQYLGIEERTELVISAVAAGAAMMPSTYLGFQPYANNQYVVDFFGLGWIVLAGFAFVKVADNHGVHVCHPSTGAAAGAVYGVIIFICGTLTQCISYIIWTGDDAFVTRSHEVSFSNFH